MLSLFSTWVETNHINRKSWNPWRLRSSTMLRLWWQSEAATESVEPNFRKRYAFFLSYTCLRVNMINCKRKSWTLSVFSANNAYSGQKIGFYVSLKYTRTYGSRQTVKFDDILVNDGNGYADRTGVFTCPVGGTYMFVVDVMLNKYTRLSLQINKTTVAYLHRDNSYTIYHYIQTSKTILLKLNKGDRVNVVSDNNNVMVLNSQDLLEHSYIRYIKKKAQCIQCYVNKERKLEINCKK